MDTPFAPYPFPLGGTVIGHQVEPPAYLVSRNGQVEGYPANGEPSAENVAADLANPPAPVVAVPQEISRPRFMIGMRKVLGLTEGAVFALISQIEDEETQEDVRDWFEHGTVFARSDHWLNLMAQAQGVTSAQLDQVFIVGASA
jgi:hypothetical protein